LASASASASASAAAVAASGSGSRIFNFSKPSRQNTSTSQVPASAAISYSYQPPATTSSYQAPRTSFDQADVPRRSLSAEPYPYPTNYFVTSEPRSSTSSERGAHTPGDSPV
jgi:hypothetical protein